MFVMFDDICYNNHHRGKYKGVAMQYQFIIKKSASKTAAIIFKGAWIEFESIDQAWSEFYKWSEEHPEYWQFSYHKSINERETPKGRGGKRPGTGGTMPGAGRPKGSGKWGDDETITVRIPKSAAPNIEKMLEAEESIKDILNLWKKQMATATTESITGKMPRTYDKALKLIADLEKELSEM